jgi:hypothetical protein
MAYVKGMTQYKVEDLEHHMGPRSFIANDIVDLLEEKGYLKIGEANLFCPERSADKYIVFWELNLPNKEVQHDD